MSIRGSIEILDFDKNNIVSKIANQTGSQDIHFLNSYNIGLTLLHSDYRDLLSESAINLVDGLILLRTVQFWNLKKPKNQTRGTDFLRQCLSNDFDGLPYFKKHYFLGSSVQVLDILKEKCFEINPSISCTFSSPPYLSLKDMDLLKIRDEIAIHDPNIVWVGLGTPKQDFVVKYLSCELGIPVVAVGAAFDFLAGTRIESTPRMRRSGLEWLTRLVDEPMRLWRRYLLVSPLSLIYPLYLTIKIESIEQEPS